MVLGDRTSRELLALRRVSFGDRATTKLTYEPTPLGAPEDLVVYLMSDCYLGMDQEVEISAAGRVELHGARGEKSQGEKSRGKGKRNGGATLAGGGKVPAPRGGKGSSSTARRAGVESFESFESFVVDDEDEDEDGFWLDAAGVAAAEAERESNPPPNETDETDDDDDYFWEAPDDDPFFWEGEDVHLERDDAEHR